ncbi:TPA: thiazole synthase [Candidatus Woesearchaeota archaeon]|nr:thiazole synthase [Candidatus Woesearchaeota archaeon]
MGLSIGRYEFSSRLFVGTGKYETFELMQKALVASGTDCVTVAIRRVNLENPKENLINFLDLKKYKLLPNTAGCFTVEDAVRVARLAREACATDIIKLEVIGDQKTLMPDTAGTIEATRILVREGFTVLAYTNDDVVAAKRLEEAGAAAVMPLAAPIGSGQGILNPANIRLILEQAKVPVIVDAGVGTASDVAIAFELGADGVLLNTAIAKAKSPVKMAKAMKLAAEAGRLAFEAGRMPKQRYATASSPEENHIE